MFNKEQFLKDLNDITGFVFDHQSEFLSTFFNDLNAYDLVSIHIGPERTRVLITLEYYNKQYKETGTQDILSDLPTEKLVDWYISKQV